MLWARFRAEGHFSPEARPETVMAYEYRWLLDERESTLKYEARAAKAALDRPRADQPFNGLPGDLTHA